MSSSQKEKIRRIAQKYGIVFVVLFGSKARIEKPNAETDLDIAVLVKGKPNYKLFGKLFSGFSDIFAGENVDVRFLNDYDLLFRYEVVKDGILLFGDSDKYLEYKFSIIKRFVDDGRKYAPFLKELLRNQQSILSKPYA